MGLRLTLVLVIVLAWASVGASWVVKKAPFESDDPDPPFFYNLSPDDLRKITISAGDKSVSWVFRETERRWYFETPADVPANLQRWGGITTLLGGPKTQRVLRPEIDDPVKYGLDRPSLVISAVLRDGSNITLDIGSATANEGAHYARFVGNPQLVLVDSSWGNVLERLAVEPPYPNWWYTMDPAKAAEVLYFKENEVVQGYGISDDDGLWYVCDLPVDGEPCKGTQLADEAAILATLQLIADHQIKGAVQLDLAEQVEYEPYGATVNAPYISIRIESETRPNVTEVTRTSMTIGALTPDGKDRYMVANETTDLLRADAAWADRILAAFEGEPFVKKS